MDLAAGGAPFYSMAYAFAGVMAGVFHRQGRLAAAVTYVLSNALAVLWTWNSGARVSSLYEVFIASVAFMLIPDRIYGGPEPISPKSRSGRPESGRSSM